MFVDPAHAGSPQYRQFWADLAAGWRPGWRGVAGTLAVGVAAALSNLVILHDGYQALALPYISADGFL